MKHTIFCVAACLFFACGVDSVGASSEELDGQGLQASALGGESQVSFRRDWSVQTSGALVVGSQLRVSYDAARLPQCRAERAGKPLWSITGYWRLGDRTGSFEAGGHSPSNFTAPPLVPLETEGELELWFQVTNSSGCTAWDSNYGENFRFRVMSPGPTVRFLSDWRVEQGASTVGAKNVVFEYEPSRLPKCRATYSGLPTWEILLWYRFDGGPAQYFPTTRADGSNRVMNPVVLAVPPGAKQLQVWFKSNDRAGCVEWDSKFGENYRYAL